MFSLSLPVQWRPPYRPTDTLSRGGRSFSLMITGRAPLITASILRRHSMDRRANSLARTGGLPKRQYFSKESSNQLEHCSI